AEAARQRAWVIVQRSHRVFDPLLQVDTDVARLVDDARNRRHRNTSLIRYFPYGRHLPASLQCKSVTSTLASCQVMLTTRRSRENQRAGNCGYVNSWRANGQPVAGNCGCKPREEQPVREVIVKISCNIETVFRLRRASAVGVRSEYNYPERICQK